MRFWRPSVREKDLETGQSAASLPTNKGEIDRFAVEKGKDNEISCFEPLASTTTTISASSSDEPPAPTTITTSTSRVDEPPDCNLGLYIRLVTISSSSSRDNIDLKLEKVRLEDVKGKYDAVSYTWGVSEIALNAIRVNGERFMVRSNIFRFLQQSSDTASPRRGPFWIDSICIDQNSLEDKNEQVSIMSNIFAMAGTVLIWLGAASESEELIAHAEQHLKSGLKLQHLLNQDLSAPKVLAPKYGGPYLVSYGREEHQRQNTLVKLGDPRLSYRNIEWQMFLYHTLPTREDSTTIHPVRHHVLQILDNPYWKRVWIVQEVILAKSPVVILGRYTLDLGDIRTLQEYRTLCAAFDRRPSEKKDAFNRSDYNLRTPIEELHNDWTSRIKNRSRPCLRNFLTGSYKRQICKDPHDMVYGYLGLTKWTRRHLSIDYERPLEILFALATQYMSVEDADDSHRNSSSSSLLGTSQEDNVTHLGASRMLLQKLGLSFQSALDFVEHAPPVLAQPLIEPAHGVSIEFKGFLVPCLHHEDQRKPHGCIEIISADSIAALSGTKHFEWIENDILTDFAPPFDIVLRIQDRESRKAQRLEVFLIVVPKLQGNANQKQTSPLVYQMGPLYANDPGDPDQAFGKVRCLTSTYLVNLVGSSRKHSIVADRLRQSIGRMMISSIELIYLLDNDCLTISCGSHCVLRRIEMQESGEYRTWASLTAYTIEDDDDELPGLGKAHKLCRKPDPSIHEEAEFSSDTDQTNTP